MKKFILILIVLLPYYVFPNAAQPGFWNAGGTGTFSLLYPTDSIYYKKIQMIRELVSIQLYRGFAVVKGEYSMFNTTSDTVRIKVGYPINSNFDRESHYDSYLIDIRFDSLYGLKAYRNSEQIPILRQTVINPEDEWESKNWFVWNNTFLPDDTTLITVYFIVNTNNTIISEGYNKDYYNGFIYLLETGATWKQPIIEGEIRIELMDNLSINDIHGVSPESIFNLNSGENIFLTRFSNLSPTAKDNIIIVYADNIDDFNFRNVLNKKEELYNVIDNLSSLQINRKNLKGVHFDTPFKVSSNNWMTSILMFILFAGGPFILIVIIFLSVTLLIIILKKKKRV